MVIDSITAVEIDWDEGGCQLLLTVENEEDGDEVLSFALPDPKAFYTRVRAGIEPWLSEMKAAQRAAYAARGDDEEAYDLSDPKHPRHHEVYADLADYATKEDA